MSNSKKKTTVETLPQLKKLNEEELAMVVGARWKFRYSGASSYTCKWCPPRDADA